MYGEWTGEIDASFARAVCDRLDEIAALGAERRAVAQEAPWTAVGPVEQQLAEAVDRLLGLEGSVTSIAGEARRAAEGGGDTRRAYAAALVLGCASSDAANQAAVSTLCSPRAELRNAAGEALSLGRSPALGPALARVIEDAGAATCAAALSILRLRRQATFATCALFLGHPDARVAAAAARCLGTLPERTAAAASLRRALVDDPDDALAVAAAESLITLGDPAGLAFVRGELEAESTAPQLLDDARVAYLRLLALAGDSSDLELFFRSLEPSPRDAAAVGWYGHPDLVDWLVGSLETANGARRTGARGRSPSAHAPSSFEIAAALALVRIAGAPDGAQGLAVEAGVWRAWWGRARARFAPGRKHRFGKPYTPNATLDEIAGEASTAVRADAALELSIVSAGSASVETGDWVMRQRAALGAAAARLAAEGPWSPGAFPGRRAGR